MSEILLSRRKILLAGGGALAASVFRPAFADLAKEAAFAQRGYYITFMRMPTFGLSAWKSAVDCFAADGINLLILWMGGGFRSKKFPITWKYNEEHENVRADFAGELIEYAQQKRVKVLLGFTPFGYDGVNQYSIEHPELSAKKKDGSRTDKFGIHCWGWNLCPSRPESQGFMRDYVEEMFLEFYPKANGVLIESSDYAICHCADCQGHFYEREFDFVQTISRRIWKEKSDAMIVVYPHYFSGAKVPGMEAQAARKKFDPRWTLFFTPHSAHPDSGLIAAANSSIWSDDAPALRDPAAIRAGAQRAHEAGISGYVPSLEAFSYVATEVEEGRKDLVGQRQVPFGFGWLKPGQMPYDQLPVRVNRIAYREFSKEPGQGIEEFKKRLGQEVFAADAQAQWIEDLLLLQRLFFAKRTWCQPAAITSPQRVRFEKAAGWLKRETLAEYRAMLKQMEEMTARHAHSSNPARNELHQIGTWVLKLWAENNDLLEDGR